MSDILTAFSGAKRSDSGGRKVVDKLYGLKGNLNPVFAGSDRPEFHKTVDGFEQVAVEKEVTNLITSGQAQQADDTQSDWGTTRTTTLDYDTVFGKNVARHEYSGSPGLFLGTRNFSLGTDPAGDVYTYEFAIRNNGGNNKLQILLRVAGGATGTLNQRKNIDITDDFQFVSLTVTIDRNDRDVIGFRVVTREAEPYDIVAGLHMPIESAYPVLFTEGTRLAPNSQITNGLVDSGTVAFKGSIVRDDSVNQDLFITSGDAGTDLSRLRLNTSNQFELQIFGSTGGTITQANPFTGWDNNTRKDIEYAVSYDVNNIYLYLSDGVSEHLFSALHDINSSTNKAFTYGNNHSLRLSTVVFKDSIVRTTQANFNDLFKPL